MKRTITPPHSFAPGANAWLEIQVGPLAPGQRVHVATQGGALLGAISPFGWAERQHAGTYSLPVPSDAIHDDALSVISQCPGKQASARADSGGGPASKIAGSRHGSVDHARLS